MIIANLFGVTTVTAVKRPYFLVTVNRQLSIKCELVEKGESMGQPCRRERDE